MARLMGHAQEAFAINYADRSRRAKRRALEILNAKSASQRQGLYRDLLKATQETVAQAKRVAERLDKVEVGDIMQLARAQSLASDSGFALMQHDVGRECPGFVSARRVSAST